MSADLRITDAERRARLIRRHHLGRTATDVLSAVRGVVALHSSDPATPYLSVRARVAGFATADLDRALCSDRTLWRLHAMRRTLFVVPADEGWGFEAAASREVARKERQRIGSWLATAMDGSQVPGWMASVEERVVAVLQGGGEKRTQELTAAVPELGTEVALGSGKWAIRSPIASRLLFLMAMDGRLVRTRPAGSWRSSQYHWAAVPSWFGAPPPPMDPESARATLARAYLAAHGPATRADLRWWTGWTARHADAALAALDTVPVRLDGGGEGRVLVGDADPSGAAAPAVALLPALDSTPMGWREREWYLDPETAAALFDGNGNIGPSVWVGGRVVGGWAQRAGGEVVYRLLVEAGAEAAAAVAAEAAALTAWLGGVRVLPRFPTPLERELRST